jgi:hypothetical protein
MVFNVAVIATREKHTQARPRRETNVSIRIGGIGLDPRRITCPSADTNLSEQWGSQYLPPHIQWAEGQGSGVA